MSAPLLDDDDAGGEPGRRVLPEDYSQERFWSKVARGAANTCWLWKGGRDPRGYGHIHVRIGDRVRGFMAHRLAYAYANGETPAELMVRHRCDNPPCVNPAHLELGTAADNSRDHQERGEGEAGERNPLNLLRLTEKQFQILLFIATPTSRGLPPPTIREIGERFGIKSTNGVSDHLKALIRKGALQKCGYRVALTAWGWKQAGMAPVVGIVSAAEVAP